MCNLLTSPLEGPAGIGSWVGDETVVVCWMVEVRSPELRLRRKEEVRTVFDVLAIMYIHMLRLTLTKVTVKVVPVMSWCWNGARRSEGATIRCRSTLCVT